MRVKPLIGFRISCVCIVWFLVAPVAAEVIELKNGDRLTGALIEVTEKTVVWKSDLLGEVFLPAEQVVHLQVYQQQWADQARLDQLVWKNSGNLSGRGVKRDKEETTSEWNINFQTEFEKEVYRHRFLLDYENNINEFGHADEGYKAGYDYNWFFKPRWYMKYSLAWARNESKNLENKYNGGVGLGYQFLNTETHRLEVEAGVDYVSKNFYTQSADQKAEYLAGAWHLDWWYKPIAQARFFHQHDIFQSFDSRSDYEVETQTGMRFLFTASLFAEVKYEWDYDSTPETANKEQSMWLFGFGYDW